MTEQWVSSTTDANQESRLNRLRALGLLELSAELIRDHASLEKRPRWVKLFADLLGVEVESDND